MARAMLPILARPARARAPLSASPVYRLERAGLLEVPPTIDAPPPGLGA